MEDGRLVVVARMGPQVDSGDPSPLLVCQRKRYRRNKKQIESRETIECYEKILFHINRRNSLFPTVVLSS